MATKSQTRPATTAGMTGKQQTLWTRINTQLAAVQTTVQAFAATLGGGATAAAGGQITGRRPKRTRNRAKQQTAGATA